MTNLDFGRKSVWMATDVKTRYGYGGWGQPLTPANIAYFLSNPRNSSNNTIKKGLETATDDYFVVDCVCGTKTLLDNFSADKTKTYGGATYGTPCPDITVEAMLKQECVDISTDMSSILIGEFVTYADYSHCGVYVGIINGKRTMAEATYRWANGWQLVDMNCDARKGKWKYHGKLWNFMDYTYKEKSLPNVNPSPTPIDTRVLEEMVSSRVKAQKGDRGSYVKEIQKVLIGNGFSCGSCGADGIYGNDTYKAVANYQKFKNLTTTGIVDYDTIRELIGD